MPPRTFAIGDIHGDLAALEKLMPCLPDLTSEDTLVFLGDYIDRGPKSAEVVEYVRTLPDRTPAKVVWLRGNHEDAWLRVCTGGWDAFVLPPGNGCLQAMRSFLGESQPAFGEGPRADEVDSLRNGLFFPEAVVGWMMSLPYWYEDECAIYVHAGLPKGPDGWIHPKDVEDPTVLMWCRDEDFFRNYQGKLVVFGHTVTECLPQELSSYTPEDPSDIFAGPCVIGLDTGAGKDGFLTALELPSGHVYESRVVK
jgi:serine/threonine protein phosphatase 1